MAERQIGEKSGFLVGILFDFPRSFLRGEDHPGKIPNQLWDVFALSEIWDFSNGEPLFPPQCVHTHAFTPISLVYIPSSFPYIRTPKLLSKLEPIRLGFENV